MNDIVDSTAATGLIEPGPEDLRWAEEMFEEWHRLLADIQPAIDPPPAAADQS